MALKGDSSQIPLANIFQTLQLNGQEGVLTVSAGKARRKLRILPSGVRLLAASRDNPDGLRLALVKMKVLTEAQFQNALSTMGQWRAIRASSSSDGGSSPPPRWRRGWRSSSASWSSRSSPGARRATSSWPATPAMTWSSSIRRAWGRCWCSPSPHILMDLARREDEWKRIRQEIPSDREIFVPLDRGAFLKPREYDLEVEAASIAEVKRQVNGEHSVEAIIAESTLAPFEILRVLASS